MSDKSPLEIFAAFEAVDAEIRHWKARAIAAEAALRAAPASPAHASDEVPGNTSTLPPPAWRLIETHDGSGDCVLVWGEIADSSESIPQWRPCQIAGIAQLYSGMSDLGPWRGESAGYHDEYYWWRPTHWKPLDRPIIHASDCAVHNEPASPSGPCDCAPTPSEDRDKGIGGEEEGSSVAESGGSPPPAAKPDSRRDLEGRAS